MHKYVDIDIYILYTKENKNILELEKYNLIVF